MSFAVLCTYCLDHMLAAAAADACLLTCTSEFLACICTCTSCCSRPKPALTPHCMTCCRLRQDSSVRTAHLGTATLQRKACGRHLCPHPDPYQRASSPGQLHALHSPAMHLAAVQAILHWFPLLATCQLGCSWMVSYRPMHQVMLCRSGLLSLFYQTTKQPIMQSGSHGHACLPA